MLAIHFAYALVNARDSRPKHAAVAHETLLDRVRHVAQLPGQRNPVLQFFRQRKRLERRPGDYAPLLQGVRTIQNQIRAVQQALIRRL
jgi:hypothetical protein